VSTRARHPVRGLLVILGVVVVLFHVTGGWVLLRTDRSRRALGQGRPAGARPDRHQGRAWPDHAGRPGTAEPRAPLALGVRRDLAGRLRARVRPAERQRRRRQPDLAAARGAAPSPGTRVSLGRLRLPAEAPAGAKLVHYPSPRGTCRRRTSPAPAAPGRCWSTARARPARRCTGWPRSPTGWACRRSRSATATTPTRRATPATGTRSASPSGTTSTAPSLRQGSRVPPTSCSAARPWAAASWRRTCGTLPTPTRCSRWCSTHRCSTSATPSRTARVMCACLPDCRCRPRSRGPRRSWPRCGTASTGAPPDYISDPDWVRGPVLIVHGTRDDTVPIATSEELAHRSRDVSSTRCAEPTTWSRGTWTPRPTTGPSPASGADDRLTRPCRADAQMRVRWKLAYERLGVGPRCPW
jgi:hypothetical protein